MKVFKSNQFLIYFWSFLFLIPLPIAYTLDINLGIRNFNYLGAAITLWWMITNRHRILQHPIKVTKLAMSCFWFALFVSFEYAYFSKFYAFRINVYDFGIFQSMLEAMLKHDWGYSSAVGFYHFGTHQNYILLLILPLYKLFHNAEILLFIGALVVWFTVYVLWLIAKELKLDDFTSFFVILVFALSPLNGLDNTFQPELFTPLFLALMYLFYLKRYWWWFCTFTLLALSTKEDAVLFVAGFGVAMLLQKNYRYALIAILLSCAIFLLNFMIVQPYFVYKSGMLEPTTLGFWSHYGRTKTDILMNVLTHPFNTILSIFSLDSGFWRLYGSLLFLPLLLPEVIFPSIITILMWGISSFFWQHQYKAYYAINLNLVLFIGIVMLLSGKSWVNNYFKKHYPRNYRIGGFLFVGCLVVFPLWGTGWQSFWGFDYNQVAAAKEVSVMIERKYSNELICPNATMYQFLMPLKLKLASFPINGANNDFQKFFLRNFPSATMYQFLIPLKLKLALFPINSSNNDFQKFFSRNCLYVINVAGDSYPFSTAEVREQLDKMSCTVYEQNFYVCRNKS